MAKEISTMYNEKAVPVRARHGERNGPCLLVFTVSAKPVLFARLFGEAIQKPFAFSCNCKCLGWFASLRSRRRKAGFTAILQLVGIALAFVLLLLYAAPVNAENSATDGAVQIDGHWIGLNWPLAGAGVRSSAYGMRIHPFSKIERAHSGLDVAAPFGTEVLAALGGRVTRTGSGRELGKYVIIAHSGARETIYGHLSEITVKEGQFVNPRKVIGKVGSSGHSTAPHLHFAVKKDGRFVDPQKWMVPTGMLK